jgi:hypothetical protein
MTEQFKRITPELARHMELYLANLQKDWGEHPSGVVSSAERIGVVPLMLDWSGYFGLRSDGALLSVPYESPTGASVELSARIRDIALKVGSKRYPALKGLLPKRTPQSQPCPYCRGTGVEPLSACSTIKNVTCWCGGLGWIPDYWEPCPQGT